MSDTRESPALRIIELLRRDGAEVSYHDPHVAALASLGLTSVELSDEVLHGFDCAVIVTDHKSVNYVQIVDQSERVVDLRNALNEESDKVVRL